MDSRTTVKCPLADCKQLLRHHEVFGVDNAASPLVVKMTKNVYECPDHGLFVYLGDRKFRRIQN